MKNKYLFTDLLKKYSESIDVITGSVPDSITETLAYKCIIEAKLVIYASVWSKEGITNF